MTNKNRMGPARFALLLLATLAACGNNDNDLPVEPRKPQAANPTVEGPIAGGGGADCCKVILAGFEVDLISLGYTPGTPFFAGLNFPTSEMGYLESEYFISGTATSYVNSSELATDGLWEIQPAETADYRSRIAVNRPVNNADFNGTVVVEWFNVTAGLDAAPDWIQMHTELIREGYAWVGVSAQFAGVEGGGAFDLPLKGVDRERYAALSHPGDSFSYDIFSQAAQSVRNPVGIDPLDGLFVERMIAVGESQSAARLATYVNAIHPTIDLFDGFLIHSRGAGSSALSQLPEVEVTAPELVLLREDLPQPVIMLQTETDLFGLNSIAVRQADSDMFRLWEVAGSAHADAYTTVKGPDDRGDDPTVADVIANKSARPPFIDCALPVNDGPGHWMAKAAIAALDRWIRTGAAAPMGPRLELDAEGTGIAVDSLGNALGGIRTPYVDAPVATLSGAGQGSGFCFLFGTTALFDDATIATLYPDHGAYVEAINAATDKAVAAGFLLEDDADLIRARALTSGIGAP